ncbi:nucleolar complex-associated protein 3 [Cryphonectria parasitica EP155]|uniref:Nucleolar complex-associated protein 3 n=1 Tax=Cryphonectria parasitica (strain ATCC 38755 / EP155) TaxID=660469 RepID=A0A9P4YAN9_CRYP1|nr:nucleolar complex-associated protein 3 [Cryphonectria parasitica EP155]KAF3770109.1 nucleolar complex-associated protein 3 [Cryphonectria parasitica EP155]
MATRPSKKRRLSPPQSENGVSDAKVQKAFFKSASGWNLEQDYESRPRKGKKKDKESNKLPIKTADGRLQQVQNTFNDAASIESDGDWLDGDEDDAAGSEPESEKVEAVPTLSEREQILKAKEELAKIGSQLSEDPEEHPGAFKNLAKIGHTRIPAVQKLCLVTQLAVYKDVIPGYRIRPSSEDPAGQKLSKEVKKVRTYEHALVTGYQVYLKDLTRYAKLKGSEDSHGLSKVAITCACTLVKAVPHFNFRTDLLKILVSKLSSRRVDESFNKCLRSLEMLFKEDEEGRPSMEAVSLLSKMMKAKKYQVHETVLNLFLYLRLLSEYSGKASKDGVDGPDGAPSTSLKKKKEFRTKRERKAMKEEKALAKEMAQADALVSHEERDRMQSETLKLVFATYFRALKERLPHLMGAVLEGLAKYAHLINQDFFGDLLEALKDLIRYSEEDAAAEEETEDAENDEEEEDSTVRNTTREALLCTVTAFALLAGQDAHNARADLHLDLSYFTTHLFQSLLPLATNANLELGAKSLHLPDPDSPQSAVNKANKVNIQTMTVLLVRCLTAVLLPPWNIRSVPPLRLAAFTKQLMTIALQMPEKSCQAMLALINDVSHTHGKKIAALWNSEERKDDGTFNPFSESVEGSNPFATTIWEGELLRRHYSPKVREGQKLLDKSLRSL